jgi:hypothetical protein
VAASYENFAQRYKKDKKFTDAAYCEGYSNGMFFAIASGLDKNGLIPPLFFHFGNFENMEPRGLQKNGSQTSESS